MTVIGTFILDFQTINFEYDSRVAIELLIDYQKMSNLDSEYHNAFALDEPVLTAGWYFAKLFLSGQFVEKLYKLNLNEIDSSKGKKFEEKFVFWLNTELKKRNCEAQIKIASEMK
jgi:hypothetical protein